MTMFGSQWLANPDTGYTIDQSIRFNKSASGSMSRTFGTPTDRNKFTYAFWMKACSESNGYCLETNVTGGVTFSGLVFNGGSMQVFDFTSGTGNIDVRTTFTAGSGKFRDYTGWYHAMFVYDSDQSTASDRLKFFVNGRQFPVDSLVGASGGSPTFPSSGFNSSFNASGVVHRISSSVNGLLDGYMADIYFIDGQALTPSSFGEFSSTTGEFVPIKYEGAFGNNGFFIDGRDSSDLGDDESGNGNDFSTSNMGTDDQVNDSPTSNHCILNALNKDTDCTLSDGNLQVGWTSGTDPIICGTMAVSSGKWYYEATFTGTFNFPAVGIAPAELSFGGSAFSSGNGALFYYAPSGNYRGNGDNVSYGAEYFVSSKIGVALNLDDNEITFFKDNSSQGTLNLASIRSGYSTWVPLVTGGGSVENIIVNFGQTDFNYTPPTGFKAWSVANMNDPTIADPSKHFATQLYTGNNTDDRAITGYNFSPDWVWIKAVNQGYSHNITDIVRGAGKYIQSNTADAEVTGPGAFGSTGSFTSDGFTLKNGSSGNLFVNDASTNYVAWAWEAGGTSGSSNSDGSVTSTVTVGSTQKFSIVKYTGTGSGNSTVGHGLGTTPSWILLKHLDRGQNWRVFHTSEGVGETGFLNTSDAYAADPDRISAVSSTTFTAKSNMNESADYIAYCFAEVEGYSKFGSYTGNGSTDGPFVNLGFKPTLLIVKRTDAGASWEMADSLRDPFNAVTSILQADTSGAESTFSGTTDLYDFLSNGFKLRASHADFNGSGGTFIYMAFARSPFKTATAYGIES